MKLSDAITKLADEIPYGHLLADTDPTQFILNIVAELADLQADRERLEWLIKQESDDLFNTCIDVSWYTEDSQPAEQCGGIGYYWMRWENFTLSCKEAYHGPFETMREAIDAAMKEDDDETK